MSSPNRTKLQIATANTFTAGTLLVDQDGAYTTNVNVDESILPVNVPLYVRAAHGHPVTGLSPWGTVLNFMIDNGWEDYSGGSDGVAALFNANHTYRIRVIALNASKVCVLYTTEASGDKSFVVIASITGLVITVGARTLVKSATVTNFDLGALNETTVVMSYCDNDNSYRGTARVGTISGTTITLGSAFVYATTTSHPTHLEVIDSTRVLVTYANQSSSGRGTAVVLTISGTSIAAGVAVVFSTGDTGTMGLSKLDTGRILVAYTDDGNGGKCTVVVLSISGTTITTGTKIVVSTGAGGVPSIVAMTSSTAIVVYSEGSVSSYGYARFLTISGTTITLSNPITFYAGATGHKCICKLDELHCGIAFVMSNNGNYTGMCIITLAGSVISVQSPVTVSAGPGVSSYRSISMCTLDLNRMCIAYQSLDSTFYKGYLKVLVAS